jgi:hypothetical protein
MHSADFLPAALAALSQPGTRALLVTLGSDGQLEQQPVAYGSSVVNLATELQDHLDAKPLSDEFLADLRNYCDSRLAAIRTARASGGFIIPRPSRWEIAHVPAYAPLEAR